MTWRLVYTRQAQEDAKKLASAGLKSKAENLLAILVDDPFRNPPPYEKWVGDLQGAYSRRIHSASFGVRRFRFGTNREGAAIVDALRIGRFGAAWPRAQRPGPPETPVAASGYPGYSGLLTWPLNLLTHAQQTCGLEHQ